MQHGLVDICIVGSDRTTRSGDVANKIGTYLKALAAFDNKIPFYVAAPISSIDFTIKDGLKNIPIEERDEKEVSFVYGINSKGMTENVKIIPKNAIIVANNGGSTYFYVTNKDKLLVNHLVRFLQSHEQFGAIFVDQGYGNLDGTIPSDNPYEKSYVFTLGHRNPTGFAWNDVGKMFATESGPTKNDEINLITAGSNYGWPEVQCFSNNDNFVNPLECFDPGLEPGGIIFYSGDKLDINNDIQLK